MQISEKAAYQVSSNRRLVLLLSATIALIAACGPSAKDSAAPAPITSAAPAASTAGSVTASVPSVPVPVSSPATVAASSSAPAKPSSKPASPSPSVPPATVPGCQAAALDVQALRGSGAAGHQYAFLQFTNSSGKLCSLTGFPGVELRRAGSVLGKPATRSNHATATVKLAPGTSATARLVDASTCQAEKSDSVQIIPPNLTQAFIVPLSIRGCALTIDPVVAG